MDFDRLRALVWTIEEGTVSAAARRLHRTQPAVSRLLRTLEDQVGHVLIDRGARPLAPTMAGRKVAESARRILALAEAMGTRDDLEAVSPTVVRLGVSRSLVRNLATPAFASSGGTLGVVDFRVRSGWSPRLCRAFARRELDCAVVLMPVDGPPAAGGRASLLRTERLMVIGPRGPSGTRMRRAVALEADPCGGWILNPDGCGFRDLIAKELVRQGRRLHVRFEVDAAPQEHVALVAAGMGLSIVPESALRSCPEAKSVVVLPFGRTRLTLGVWLLATEELSREDALMQQLARAFSRGARAVKTTGRKRTMR